MRSVGAVLLVVAAIALPSIGSAQKLYKWTDENGVVQFDYRPPPEYRIPWSRPQDPRESPAEADKRAKDEIARRDLIEKEGIARRDRMLLETFRSVTDIEDLRDRRLALLDSQIKLTETWVANLHKKLEDLQAEASNYKPYSTQPDAPQIPDDLALDISRTEASIMQYEQLLARTRADQAALKKAFDDDIARFIEIKGE